MGIWFVSAHVRPGFSTPPLTLCRYIIRVCVQSIGMCVTHRVQVGQTRHRITQDNTQGTDWVRVGYRVQVGQALYRITQKVEVVGHASKQYKVSM